MFNFLKKKSAPDVTSTHAADTQSYANRALRDALFGDTPLPQLLGSLSRTALALEPWATFARAQSLIDAGNTAEAASVLQTILTMPQAEPRVVLEIWCALRGIGLQPPSDKAKELLGVVVEVGLPGGVDLVAAWPNHCARYWNQIGGGVVWEGAEGPTNAFIDDLLRTGDTAIKAIGHGLDHAPNRQPTVSSASTSSVRGASTSDMASSPTYSGTVSPRRS